MSPLRSLCASLMLAVVACGGVGAPLVHEVTHAAERIETRAEHAADGHHETGDETRVSDECPLPKPPLDIDCVLCTGLTAALVASSANVPTSDSVADVYAARPPPQTGTFVSTPASRGPPQA